MLGCALQLVHVENDGVAFGRLSGSPVLVALVVAVALVALVVYVATHLDVPGIWLPTGMLLGGAIGNVVDRVARGSVTDYVKCPALAGVQRRGRLHHARGRRPARRGRARRAAP